MYGFGTLDLGKSLEIPELSISRLHAVKTRMFSSFPNPSLKLACWSGSAKSTFFFLTLKSLTFQSRQISAASIDHPGALCVLQSRSQVLSFVL